MSARAQVGLKKYNVNFLITRDIQPIGKLKYSYLDLKWAHILQYKLFYNSCRGQDKIVFIKAKHGLVSYFYK